MREFFVAAFIFGSLAFFAVMMDDTPHFMETVSVVGE